MEKLLKKVRPLLLLKDSVCERSPQRSCRWPNIRFLDQTLGRLRDFSHEISHPDVTLLSSSISSWHQPSGRNAEYILIIHNRLSIWFRGKISSYHENQKQTPKLLIIPTKSKYQIPRRGSWQPCPPSWKTCSATPSFFHCFLPTPLLAALLSREVSPVPNYIIGLAT